MPESSLKSPAPSSGPLLDVARLDDARSVVATTPFPYLLAHGQLPTEAQARLQADFPRYRGAGFFPYEARDCGPSIIELVETLLSPAFADAIGLRLGVPELSRYPTLITLCRALNLRHGTIHTDSLSKVVTALVYLNERWDGGSAGCFRVLANGTDIDALLAPELPPLFGNLAAFRRTENSFHGHLPFEGERLVIQVAWLTSEEEKRRKTRRGHLSRVVKWLSGALDRRWKAR